MAPTPVPSPAPDADRARDPVVPLVAAAAVLVAYLGGRWLFELAGSRLGAAGVSPGLSSVVPLPLYAAVVAGGMWASVRLAGSRADPRPALAAPSAAALRQVAAGAVLAGLLVALVYGIAVAAGWARPERAPPGAHLATGLAAYGLLYAGIAWNEELVFRWSLPELLGVRGGLAIGVAASSALFAAVHLLEDVTSARLAGLFLLGLLLALLRIRSRSLWPAIGAHWGIHVLSHAAAAGLLSFRVVLAGPLLLVGTPDQLDAGLLMIGVLAAAAGLVAACYHPRAA